MMAQRHLGKSGALIKPCAICWNGSANAVARLQQIGDTYPDCSWRLRRGDFYGRSPCRERRSTKIMYIETNCAPRCLLALCATIIVFFCQTPFQLRLSKGLSQTSVYEQFMQLMCLCRETKHMGHMESSIFKVERSSCERRLSSCQISHHHYFAILNR